jgi:hypothetical protein
MWQTLNDGAYIKYPRPLPEVGGNIIFGKKLIIFRDKNYDACREIFSESAKPH